MASKRRKKKAEKKVCDTSLTSRRKKNSEAHSQTFTSQKGDKKEKETPGKTGLRREKEHGDSKKTLQEEKDTMALLSGCSWRGER